VTDYDFLHESELVVLQVPQPRRCAALWAILTELGYTLREDVFSFDRRENAPPWQSEAVVELDVLLSGVELLLTDNEARQPDQFFDTVRAEYLLATLPREHIPVFAEQVALLGARLEIPLRHQRRIISRQELEAQFDAYADELTAALGEPGSEGVAIYIESTYPR
jgi:hypothetical protein